MLLNTTGDIIYPIRKVIDPLFLKVLGDIRTNEEAEEVIPGYKSGGYVAIIAEK